jgi:hypothetical protein
MGANADSSLTAGGWPQRMTDAVGLPPELQCYRLPPGPDSQLDASLAWLASFHFLEVAPLQVTLPLWAAMYRAPISSILPPTFVLWLYGGSGTRPSTLAALALSHFGDWTADDFIDWNRTAGALSKLMFAAKDVPLVIDGYALPADGRSGRRLESTVATVVRDVGNHSGRARIKGDRSLGEVYRPRGLVMATGQRVPRTRWVLDWLVPVEIRPDDLDLKRLSEERAHKAQYAVAMAGYVDWLRPRTEQLKQTFLTDVYRYAEQFQMPSQHLRVGAALGHLYAGFLLAIQYGQATLALSEEDALRWTGTGFRVLGELGKQHAHLVQDKTTDRFLSIIGLLLARGEARLEPLRPKRDGGRKTVDGGRPTTDDRRSSARLIGWYDHNFYLLPDAAYQCVTKFAKAEGRRLGIQQNPLREALALEGMIGTEEGHNTVRVYKDGLYLRVLRIRRPNVEKEWGWRES